VTIQLVHRSMVLTGSLLVVAFLITLLRSKDTYGAERTLSIGGLGLLAAQIVVGALSAVESSHTEFADIHLAFAAALWGVVVAVFALSARGHQSRSDSSEGERLSVELNASRLPM
jgi:heme A synthase